MSSPTEPVSALEPDDLPDDPFAAFADWLDGARRAGVHEPEAMTLATATPDGVPSARMVLLRGSDRDGFVFYTNYDSRKGSELLANPRAALVVHWASIGRQIRVEGAVARTSNAESDAYFAARHRGSQLGAWASAQSRPIADRAELEAQVAAAAVRFADGPVPRPPNWGGFRLSPVSFEFWQHADNRLHDRFRYDLVAPSSWTRLRLAP